MRRAATALLAPLFVTGLCALAACGGVDVRVERADDATTIDATTVPPGTTGLPAPSTTTSPSPPGTSVEPPGSTTVAPSSSAPPTSGPDGSCALTPETGDGVGDELFPDLGNPGLDVQHYDVQLAFDTATDLLHGSVALDVVLTQPRDEITLDSVGPDIERVTIDGDEATYDQDGVELRITPPVPLDCQATTRIEVEYSLDTVNSSGDGILPSGWFNTAGGSYVLNEPDATRTWLPSNDHPSDKATFDFVLTVPAGLTAVANGALVEHTTTDAGERWAWAQSEPMATYLIQLLTGDYELIEGETVDGVPLLSAVLRDDVTRMQPYIDAIPAQIAFFEELFGPYPLDRYGLAIIDSFGGLAMETQGRSLFSRDDMSGELGFVEELLTSHELTHQWFGDAVSPANWQAIWLNESFATYGEWMWLAEVGMGTVDEFASAGLAGRPQGATATPEVSELFSFNSYDGGGAIVHALRRTMGDAGFFELLQRWVAEGSGTSRTTEDFVELASEVGGEDLTAFFDEWLYAEQLPADFPPTR